MVGPTGSVVGMTTFGASAPIKDLQKKFGFTVENVVLLAKPWRASQRNET
jgi:transketolase